MPILSRRSIQKLINDSSTVTGNDEMYKIVERLNKENGQSLDALWELIIISLLSRHGTIGYELNHGGKTEPDVFFKNEEGLELVADITCISDQDQNKNNDVEYFNSELSAVAKKLGIDSLSGFDIRVKDDRNQKLNNVKLKLPHKNDTRKFIKLHIKPFLIAVAQSKERQRRVDVDEEGVELSIYYNPDSKYLTFGHTTFTIAKHITKNPIFNRLKAKSKQLKACGFEGLKGVIICDGGCDLMTTTITGHSSHSTGSVIDNFLKNQNTISFVIVVYIEEHRDNMLVHKVKRNFSFICFAKDNCRGRVDSLTRNLRASAVQLLSPIATAKNASSALKNSHSFPKKIFYGGYIMTDKKISISARALLDLISGKVNSEQLMEELDHVGMLLKHKIEQGYKLNSLSLSTVEGSDDDWVELLFEDTFDPAVSRYTSS